jgi:hypothetical protein
MGKIIKDSAGREIELVGLEEARTFLRGRKGQHMTKNSLLQKIYRGKIKYHKSVKGNYWFEKNYLLGLKEDNAA